MGNGIVEELLNRILSFFRRGCCCRWRFRKGGPDLGEVEPALVRCLISLMHRLGCSLQVVVTVLIATRPVPDVENEENTLSSSKGSSSRHSLIRLRPAVQPLREIARLFLDSHFS